MNKLHACLSESRPSASTIQLVLLLWRLSLNCMRSLHDVVAIGNSPRIRRILPGFAVSPGVPVMAQFLLRIAVSTQQHYNLCTLIVF